MKENKLIPKRRFKVFENDEAWGQREFKDNIVSIQTGTNLLGSEMNCGIPLLKMGNIQRGYFSFDKLEYLDEHQDAEEENITQYGDFLFNTRNTLKLVGKGATWTGSSGKYAFNSNIARFTFDGIDTIFFNYLYNTQQMIAQVQARAVGTTSVAAVYPRDLNSIKYHLPNFDEQNKIGEFFMQLDNLITLHQRKLKKLKETKSAYLSEMFPKEGEKYPKRRFAGFTDPWEQRKFSDYYKVCSGFAFKYQDYVDDGVPIVNGESIQHAKVDSNSFNYLPENFRKDYSDFLLYEDDIVVGLNRPITDGNLKISKIPKKLDRSLLYQRAGKIKFIAEIDTDFSYVLLQKEILKHTLKEAVGSDQPFISTSKLNEWKMMIPKSGEEQIKIGTFFNYLDNLIVLHQRKLEKLEDIKSAYLNEMFV